MIFRRIAVAFFLIATFGSPQVDTAQADHNLSYLTDNNPWYPHHEFPMLITPQWVGEEGVDAVVVLAIDDMRDTAKYEAYLRPILQRLKQIDGRAPVSIMTCSIKPDDPRLQTWIDEGLSIEVHTIDHPCPLLAGERRGEGQEARDAASNTQPANGAEAPSLAPRPSPLSHAAGTYHRCVDLLNQIPGNSPIAFRMPCCDSLNTVSPRFYSEIFNGTSPEGRHLGISSSVFNLFTRKDPTNFSGHVINKDGSERFRRYIPKGLKRGGLDNSRFVNTIENYPYPFVVNRLCWEFPCAVPSDWEAQFLQQPNNPRTVEDMKMALKLTVRKKGVFNLVFHPHGWIKSEQVVDIIDYATETFGKRVKFLTFREAHDRLNKNLLAGNPLRSEDGGDNGVRIVDVDRDGFMDVVIGNDEVRKTRVWDPQKSTWSETGFVTNLSPRTFKARHAYDFGRREGEFVTTPGAAGVNFVRVHLLSEIRSLGVKRQISTYRFDDGEWIIDRPLQQLFSVALRPGQKHPDGRLVDVRFRQLNRHGSSVALATRGVFDINSAVFKTSVWHWNAKPGEWVQLRAEIPARVSRELAKIGKGIRFADLDDSGDADIILSDKDGTHAWLMDWYATGKATPLRLAKTTPPVIRPDGSDNGFFFRDGDLCWINESTDGLNDLTERIPVAGAVRTAERHKKLLKLRPALIGAAKMDITPVTPIRLAGYGGRMKESEGVADRIFARALVIGGHRKFTKDEFAWKKTGEFMGSGQGLLLEPDMSIVVSVENCGVPDTLTNRLCAELARRFGVARQRIAVCSTHSHSAPWLREFSPLHISEVTPEQHRRLAQYEVELLDKMVKVVTKAVETRRPGKLAWGTTDLNFAINRRRLDGGRWAGFGAVPDGPVDHRMPLLVARDLDGHLIGLLANYACHCTTVGGDFNQISGDWAGYASRYLEEELSGRPSDKVAARREPDGARVVDSRLSLRERSETGLGRHFRGAKGDSDAVALISIGCGADANPEPRGGLEVCQSHGRSLADKVLGLIQDEDELTPLDPRVVCRMTHVDLPLGPLPETDEWEARAKEGGSRGKHARHFLELVKLEKPLPTSVHDYPVQTWVFGDELAMVFLGGEVVVDYAMRMSRDFDGERLWFNSYSNSVPCYIASKRLLREGGYEVDSSMYYYAQPTRVAPETEDIIVDTVQKLLPPRFYSKKLQTDFPPPTPYREAAATMHVKPGFKIELVAREPMVQDPVAFDWDPQGRLWVVQMGDYPEAQKRSWIGEEFKLFRQALKEQRLDSKVEGQTARERILNGICKLSWEKGIEEIRRATSREVQKFALQQLSRHHEEDVSLASSLRPEAGSVVMLEDTDGDGKYNRSTRFMSGLNHPTGIRCWKGGVLITAAPDIIFARDNNGNGQPDVREVIYTGFAEGNQQHRVNGLEWGLDNWLHVANGDSGGTIQAMMSVPMAEQLGGPPISQPPPLEFSPDWALGRKFKISGRDLRIRPNIGAIETEAGQAQFGRCRDDWGNWFGCNNSNPMWHYVLSERYVRRNPHVPVGDLRHHVFEIPGASPVYPRSRTLARFNDFSRKNRFTSACSTTIYRDTLLGESFYGNSFTCEPVHNLISRRIVEPDGITFKAHRADSEKESEFLASTDNWFRPVYARTGPDGALWIADMYRFVIEHPKWIPAEHQRRLDLKAGDTMGRIWRVVPDNSAPCCGDPDSPNPPATSLVVPPSGGANASKASLLSSRTFMRPPTEKPIRFLPGDDSGSDNFGAENLRRRRFTHQPGVSRAAAPPQVEVKPARYAESVPQQSHDSLCNAFGVAAATDKVLGWRRCAADPRLMNGTPSAYGRFDFAAGEGELFALVESGPANPPEGGTTNEELEGETTNKPLKPQREVPPPAQKVFSAKWDEIPVEELVTKLASRNGWVRDRAQQVLINRQEHKAAKSLWKMAVESKEPLGRLHALCTAAWFDGGNFKSLVKLLNDPHPGVRRHAVRLSETLLQQNRAQITSAVLDRAADSDPQVQLQVAYSLGYSDSPAAGEALGRLAIQHECDPRFLTAVLSSIEKQTALPALRAVLDTGENQKPSPELVAKLLGQVAAYGEIGAVTAELSRVFASLRKDATAGQVRGLAVVMKEGRRHRRSWEQLWRDELAERCSQFGESQMKVALDPEAENPARLAALEFLSVTPVPPIRLARSLADLLSPSVSADVQLAAVDAISASGGYRTPDILLAGWKSHSPRTRAAVTSRLLERAPWSQGLLLKIKFEVIAPSEIAAAQRQTLLNSPDAEIKKLAASVFQASGNSNRAAIIESFSPVKELKGDLTRGTEVFRKRCGSCHQLGAIGKQLGADLAALRDRSTDALLTAILDPNRAVEAKFLNYAAVTNDGKSYSGMLRAESSTSITLATSDGKEVTLLRKDLDTLVGSPKSFMPEGLEKDLSHQEMADVLAFVQSSGTPWKRFDGNQPTTVKANEEGAFVLPASAAAVYGPGIVFESKYGNLGFWGSDQDYVVWTLDVPKSGAYEVTIDYACDNGTAGNPLKLSTGSRVLTANVPGTGTWDDYRTWKPGTIELSRGTVQLTVSPAKKPNQYLIDLRSITLRPAPAR